MFVVCDVVSGNQFTCFLITLQVIALLRTYEPHKVIKYAVGSGKLH